MAVVSHIALQFSIVFTRTDWSLSAFRDYGAGDQLSYAAIVANAAQGQLQSFEPFTETGSIYYPRAYYMLLGIVAHLFGVSPTVAWSLGGLFCQIVLVAGVSIACMVITRRLWTGLLGAAPFVLGTLSTVFFGSWFTRMDSHAVLWGPFAVLYPLNGEAAGLCLGALALLLILVAYLRLNAHRSRVIAVLIASAGIGLIANMQTYSFLTASYFAAYLTAAVTVALTKKWWPVAVSVVLVPVVFLWGPIVASNLSQLAALGFGLLPAAPGLVLAVIRTRGLVAWGGLAAIVFAAPSVLSTAEGLRERDPFLVYRVASSLNLGVIPVPGVLGGLVLLVPLALVLSAGIHKRNALWVGYPVGAIAAWFVVATNDRWGANQEPYRFWIDAFVLIAVTLLPIALQVALAYLPGRKRRVGLPEVPRPQRIIARVAAVVVIGLALVSSLDFARFYIDSHNTPLLRFDSPRDDAVGMATLAADGNLVATDPCINPLSVKVITGAPVAFMNVGMAWPEQYDGVNEFLIDRQVDSEFNVAAARNADVAYLLTDDGCPADWAADYADDLAAVDTFDYIRYDGEPHTIKLWRLND